MPSSWKPEYDDSNKFDYTVWNAVYVCACCLSAFHSEDQVQVTNKALLCWYPTIVIKLPNHMKVTSNTGYFPCWLFVNKMCVSPGPWDSRLKMRIISETNLCHDWGANQHDAEREQESKHKDAQAADKSKPAGKETNKASETSRQASTLRVKARN